MTNIYLSFMRLLKWLMFRVTSHRNESWFSSKWPMTRFPAMTHASPEVTHVSSHESSWRTHFGRSMTHFRRHMGYFRRHMLLLYRVAKTHRMSYLYRSFSTKEPYKSWLIYGENPCNLRHPTHLRHSVSLISSPFLFLSFLARIHENSSHQLSA